jgi:hypothetical protein
MTQILVYRTPEEVVLATDSRAVAPAEDRADHHFLVVKLFHLAPHVVLAAGGAGLGLELCRRFQEYVKRKGLWNLEEIAYQALPFMQAEMQAIRRDPGFTATHPELERLYIILAGYMPNREENPAGFVLFGSDSPEDPLTRIATGPLLAVPRWMSLEYRLARMPPEKADADKIEKIFETSLIKTAREDAEIAPPFHFVRIDHTGARFRVVPEIDG